MVKNNLKLNLLLLILISFFLPNCKNSKIREKDSHAYNDFLLREVANKKCFINKRQSNYFNDSLKNVSEFLNPSFSVIDSINRIKLNFHSWPTSSSCIYNNFVVIEKEDESLFLISMCDENLSTVANKEDTLILAVPQLERDINHFLSESPLKDTLYFVSLLFKGKSLQSLDSTSIKKIFRGRDITVTVNRILNKMSNDSCIYFKTKSLNGVYEVKTLNGNSLDINILNYRNLKCFDI